MYRTFTILTSIIGFLMAVSSCNSDSSQQSEQMGEKHPRGSYGYDLNFLREHEIEFIELVSDDSTSRIAITPGWQARVMTSTSSGLSGKSNGWINYDLIKSGEPDPQFNPFGGEERFWLGPEGGPFSLYFKEGDEQVYGNWKVPEFIDTKPFTTRSQNHDEAVFTNKDILTNAAGNQLEIDVLRKVRLLGSEDVAENLDINLPQGLNFVAYQSENTIRNAGSKAWTPDHGFVSIWVLCMFNPGPSGVVIIPAKEEGLSREEILTDDYFGKVPDDRLTIKDGIIYFKVDGKMRSKIGVSPAAATPLAAAYDGANQLLTVVKYSGPDPGAPYVNSVWGEQDDPLAGDAINAYNDGPVDGKVMGPFYEIETSSAAALLKPDESMSHIQSVFHFKGNVEALEDLLAQLFDIQSQDIQIAFKK